MRNYKLLYLLPLFLFGCGAAEFSPNQKFDSDSPENVNATQITALSRKTPGAVIRIAVSSDTHTDYEDSRAFVNYVNTQGGFDFVMLNGDITNFGLLTEFEGIYKIYAKLNTPFITVVGNHDENAEGNHVFRRMFGEQNFTFSYGGIKFVCHDSNSREHTFDHTTPDLGWLQQNLTQDADNKFIVGFSHVPPIDADFDQDLRLKYEELFNSTPGVLASVHSHRHSADSIYRAKGAGIPFIITNTILNRTFTVIEITNGKLSTHPVTF
ncbi:Calcineurin-like phosphoesterase [Pedobacter westerhofensis]|uniref:Calcineurin-like phosphoesterase n=1 Tax=Pedobacter westerhofensis TaxID=425512 RepID=A0A521E8M9_9SPHI|nr:metallophosphoesterase [Pedobacter westerhofensis]SMO80267.1 Calcineurin-like phosphoesterase [Pedobacter westerhofensis]